MRALALLLLAIGAGTADGCGEAPVPGASAGTGTVRATASVPNGTPRTGTAPATPSASGATPGAGTAPAAPSVSGATPGTGTAPATGAAAAKRRSIVARVDASSDKIIAEGKLHIAPGAPSDAEVRRELQAARKAGIVPPSGNSAESFAKGATYSAAPAGVDVPATSWNPRSKPIADWIIPVLEWASQHGWTGTVTSGFRTLYEQVQLNAAGAFSAPAGFSNHETAAYPGGAVDVTNPSQLITVLRGYPGPEKLVGGVLGPVDPEHFSATGD